MRDVICNTSPLQYLHQADLLHLLPTLFGSVQAPSAVATELAEGRRRGVCLPELADLPWVTVRPVSDRKLLPLVTSLGNGEKEVLALGLEMPGHLLVLDDRNARRYAAAAGLKITGTLGILVIACMSHHPTVEARDTPAMTSLRLLAVLNVLFKYACARQAARASS
ncbi:MAG: hypothetical protein OXL36_10015 [Bryobacterales bacterium]|nr:hypothetical protein [Bryobacterales bacterium]MDE0292621.1 hypothetical protein [Bryobacterales bacterium]